MNTLNFTTQSLLHSRIFLTFEKVIAHILKFGEIFLFLSCSLCDELHDALAKLAQESQGDVLLKKKKIDHNS